MRHTHCVLCALHRGYCIRCRVFAVHLAVKSCPITGWRRERRIRRKIVADCVSGDDYEARLSSAVDRLNQPLCFAGTESEGVRRLSSDSPSLNRLAYPLWGRGHNKIEEQLMQTQARDTRSRGGK